MNDQDRYEVFTVTERDDKTYWARVGTGFVNRDGSINIALEALPVSGKLQLRQPKARERDDAPPRERDRDREPDRSRRGR